LTPDLPEPTFEEAVSKRFDDRSRSTAVGVA
jgi:hypothetical protein